MKHLVLDNPGFIALEKGFAEWLSVLGYAQTTVYNVPSVVREFLHFLEQNEVRSIRALEQAHFEQYYQYVSHRANQRPGKRGSGLSNSYLNSHLFGLEKFMEYLHHRGMHDLPALTISHERVVRPEITVLTIDEIRLLYRATEEHNHHHLNASIVSRDQTLLTIFYGCGLRRSEGSALRIEDINFDTRVLHVRKGKNYRERFVPFNRASAKTLESYVYDYRPLLLKTRSEGVLFVSANDGKPLTGQALYQRLKILQQRTEDTDLLAKDIGLHTLRHSIATHLLSAGMDVQKISRFLGHRSLESTQIYTHLVKHHD